MGCKSTVKGPFTFLIITCFLKVCGVSQADLCLSKQPLKGILVSGNDREEDERGSSKGGYAVLHTDWRSANNCNILDTYITCVGMFCAGNDKDGCATNIEAWLQL